MHRTLLPLGTLVFLACGGEPASPNASLRADYADAEPPAVGGPEWVETEVALDFTDYPGCLGEAFQVSGPILVRELTVTDGPSALWTLEASPLPGLQLLGLTSGTVWSVDPAATRPVQPFRLRYRLGQPFQATRAFARWVFINTATGERFRTEVSVHAARGVESVFTTFHLVDTPCADQPATVVYRARPSLDLGRQ